MTMPERVSFYLGCWQATKELITMDGIQTLDATEHLNCTTNSSCSDSRLTQQSSHKLVFHVAHRSGVEGGLVWRGEKSVSALPTT